MSSLRHDLQPGVNEPVILIVSRTAVERDDLALFGDVVKYIINHRLIDIDGRTQAFIRKQFHFLVWLEHMPVVTVGGKPQIVFRIAVHEIGFFGISLER